MFIGEDLTVDYSDRQPPGFRIFPVSKDQLGTGQPNIMSVVQLTSGKRFETPAGTSILDAALRQNIAMPYSCRAGRCSACKCRVINGQSRALAAETGLSDQERRDGWILSCVRTVESDALIEADDLGDFDLPLARTLPCRINDIQYPRPDVARVFLRLPPKAEFRFLPGQYVEVIGEHGVRRSYSLANAQRTDGLLELHVRAVPNGVMSEYWFGRAKPNDLLRLNGPLGTFFVRATAGRHLVFLATGTGIAPIQSMIESIQSLSAEALPQKVTILWGGRSPVDFYTDLAGLRTEHDFIPVVSRPFDGWQGAKGYVQDVFAAIYPDFENTDVYACGSDAMISSAKNLLLRAGLPEKRFYADAFVSSGAAIEIKETA